REQHTDEQGGCELEQMLDSICPGPKLLREPARSRATAPGEPAAPPDDASAREANTCAQRRGESVDLDVQCRTIARSEHARGEKHREPAGLRARIETREHSCSERAQERSEQGATRDGPDDVERQPARGERAEVALTV